MSSVTVMAVVADDLVAAVAELCQRGVTTMALAGASMGGSATLIATTRVKPPVDAVAELSGQATPTSLLRISLNRDALRQLILPTLFVIAKYDQDTSVDEPRAMYQSDKPADERLLLLPVEFDDFHGWMVLPNTTGGFSSTTTKVAELVPAHTPRRFSESLVAYGIMVLRSCGRGAATPGLDRQMPREYGAGWARRPCLRWRRRSRVVATATAEMPRQVAGIKLAVVEVFSEPGGVVSGTCTDRVSPGDEGLRGCRERAGCGA
jgi:hypothetical protein